MRKTPPIALPLYLCVASLVSCTGSRALAQPQSKVAVAVADDRITFPERFSLSEFFDLVAQSIGIQIIAPGDDKDGLVNKLNESLANRQVSAKEAIERYSAVRELSGYGSFFSLSVIDGPYPGSSKQSIKNAQAELERKTTAWNFILSLSKDQISQMYTQGYLSADLLTAQQKPLYIKLIRMYRFGTSPEKTPSDAELLAKPTKFRFSLTASFAVESPGKEETSWIGMYDYGTGLIWNPLAPASNALLPVKETQEETKPPQPQHVVLTIGDKPVVEFSKTHVWTIREALDTIQQRSGKKVVVAEDLSEETLQKTHVVLTKGSYSLDELMDRVSATIGAELRPTEDGFYLGQTGFRGQLRRYGWLRDKFNKAEQTLQRLPSVSSALPFFFRTLEEQDELPYTTLNATQKSYIRARLINEQDDKYTNLDLDRSKILFAKTLWFTEFSNEGAMMTTNYQVW